jgi:hypothetical protein
VTDPAHPLYERVFELALPLSTRQRDGHLWVQYRDGIVLRLPRAVTNLSLFGPHTPRATLSHSAVEEFLSLVKEYESCRTKSTPASSGTVSRAKNKRKSSRN